MFLQEICTKQEKQLKELKSKLASLTSSYKELVGKIKVFANLNIELPSKISELEASANTALEASPRT
jgi:septal ring factor EnvC (AmiA/AmiB activator)